MSEVSENKVNGVDPRLLDGYDGGTAPSDEFVKNLLANAPPEVKARAEQFAKERASWGVAKQ